MGFFLFCFDFFVWDLLFFKYVSQIVTGFLGFVLFGRGEDKKYLGN